MRAWPNFSRVPNVRITASYVTPSTTCSTREPLASSSASGNDGALVVALLAPLPKPLGFFDPESLPPPPLALSGDVARARDLVTGALPFFDLLEGPCERKRAQSTRAQRRRLNRTGSIGSPASMLWRVCGRKVPQSPGKAGWARAARRTCEVGVPVACGAAGAAAAVAAAAESASLEALLREALSVRGIPTRATKVVDLQAVRGRGYQPGRFQLLIAGHRQVANEPCSASARSPVGLLSSGRRKRKRSSVPCVPCVKDDVRALQ